MKNKTAITYRTSIKTRSLPRASQKFECRPARMSRAEIAVASTHVTCEFCSYVQVFYLLRYGGEHVFKVLEPLGLFLVSLHRHDSICRSFKTTLPPHHPVPAHPAEKSSDTFTESTWTSFA